VIALLATTASLFGYITTNYFLAQVLVMPLVLGELLVLHWLAAQSSWRERAGGLVLVAAIVVTATLSYSPMAFFMQPIILAAVCLGEVGREWLRRSAAVFATAVGAFVVAFVLAPVPFWRSAEFARKSLGSEKGWPLGLMTPLDALGLRQAVRTPRPSVGAFLFESFIVGVVVLVGVWALWNRERRAALFYASAAFVVFGSYAAVYVDRGYSYEQWKWISFFQPMFIVAVFALAVAAGGVVITKWLRLPPITVLGAGVVLGVALVGVSARTLVSGTARTRAVWVVNQPTISWSIVGSPLSQLPERTDLERLSAVNVALSQWDTMWAAYFLEPTTRVYPGYTGYYPTSTSPGAPTLKPEPDPTAPPTAPRVRYVLVEP
jgi:hypothetical protein